MLRVQEAHASGYPESPVSTLSHYNVLVFIFAYQNMRGSMTYHTGHSQA